MTDLALRPAELPELLRIYPNLPAGYRRARELFSKIETFHDVELYLMKGQGLAASSYRVYMSAVRGLYQHSGGLSPLSVTPEVLEDYYDSLVQRGVSRATCYNQMAGLRRFFSGVSRQIPGWVSPFEILEPKLARKLNRTGKSKTRKALNKGEVRALLSWLEGRAEYAMVYMLVTSGLRAAELCQLRWRDIDYDPEEKRWSATFTQKGGDTVTAELYGPAVESCGRRGSPDAYLFTRPNGRPYDPHALWYRIQKVGREAKEQNIITRQGLIFSPHLFRRTFVTLLYRAGMKVKALQAKSRHKSTDTLMRHYVDDSESASGYLDRVFAA